MSIEQPSPPHDSEEPEIARIQLPDVTPQQADMLINNQLYPSSIAAYYIEQGEAGNIAIQETETNNVRGYRIKPLQRIHQGSQLEKLTAIFLNPLDEPVDMPQPASQEAWDAFDPQTQKLKYSSLFMVAGHTRRDLVEQGYIRDPAAAKNYAGLFNVGRWVWIPGGLATGGLLGIESESIGLGVSAGLMTAVILQRGVAASYHWLESRSAATLNEGRLLPRGQAALERLGKLESEMQQALDGQRPLSPSECRELLPYAIIRNMHDEWLATPTAQQAYRTPPKWLRPLNQHGDEQPTPTARLQTFIDFCMSSVVQPGEIHLMPIPSAHLHRQAALGQAHNGLADFGDSMPEAPN